jgi:hypothetical protein
MDQAFKVAVLLEGRSCAHFTVEGMVGAERKNPDRPVSLMSLAARQGVDHADRRGLCFKRFVADITLDCNDMPPTAARLQCGDLVLSILPERKRCWQECFLFQNDLPCPLIEGVRYARVESPGKICQGDEFLLTSTDSTYLSDKESG